MSTPDYLSYSTVTSSSNTNYTVIRTKNNSNKNFNNYFQSDSASHSETSKINNMNRKIIPRRHTMAHYTINDTSASESTTYTSKNSNSSKNSDMSYNPRTDDTISDPVNKLQTTRKNKNNSKKYIQQKHHTITGTTKIVKSKNRRPSQKNKLIPRRLHIHKNKINTTIKNNTSSNNLINIARNKINVHRSKNKNNNNFPKINTTTTDTHKDNSYHQQHNKNTDLCRKTQFLTNKQKIQFKNCEIPTIK